MSSSRQSKVKLKQPVQASKGAVDNRQKQSSRASNEADKAVINQLKQKIDDLAQDEANAKKLANLISSYINKKNK